MCVVSVMIDSAREQWPSPYQMPYREAVDFSDIIRRISEIDKNLGVKDCFDPKKNQYIQELEGRIAELEQKSTKKKPAKKR